jgi:hypothetical protein
MSVIAIMRAEEHNNRISEMRAIYKSTKVRKSARRYYWIAASLLLVICSILLIKSINRPHEKLFNAYYKPYPGEVIERGHSQKLISKVLQDYIKGDYEAVVFELSSRSNLSDSLYFYLANSYLNLGKYSKAKSSFKQIGKGSTYHISSQWYIALIYLHENQLDSCEIVLKKYSDTPSVYQHKMRSLLTDLNQH